MLESKLQAKSIEFLNNIGAYVVNTIVSSKNGVPDLLCCYEGRFYGFEQKTDDGIKSEIQQYNINLINSAGGVAGFVVSVNDIAKLMGVTLSLGKNKHKNNKKIIYATSILEESFRQQCK